MMHADENGETEHEEKPGPGPYQPEGSPSSPESATHMDENEETIITSTKLTLHGCKGY